MSYFEVHSPVPLEELHNIQLSRHLILASPILAKRAQIPSTDSPDHQPPAQYPFSYLSRYSSRHLGGVLPSSFPLFLFFDIQKPPSSGLTPISTFPPLFYHHPPKERNSTGVDVGHMVPCRVSGLIVPVNKANKAVVVLWHSMKRAGC